MRSIDLSINRKQLRKKYKKSCVIKIDHLALGRPRNERKMHEISKLDFERQTILAPKLGVIDLIDVERMFLKNGTSSDAEPSEYIALVPVAGAMLKVTLNWIFFHSKTEDSAVTRLNPIKSEFDAI